MEKENGLKLITLKQSDFLRTLENAIQFGQPVLLQEVLEELDPALEPIMSRAVVKQGNRQIIKLGDKEVDYNPEFRFYLTTKLPNPHYTPEISTKATIVNFCVKQQGLDVRVAAGQYSSADPIAEWSEVNLFWEKWIERQKPKLQRAAAAALPKAAGEKHEEVLRELSGPDDVHRHRILRILATTLGGVRGAAHAVLEGANSSRD